MLKKPRLAVDSSTLVHILRWRARHQPDQRAYTFLIDGESDERHLTYAELDQQAHAIATALTRDCVHGDRALLLYPPGLDYIAAFFGCLYAGVIAVPAYPPDPARLDRSLPRLRAIVTDAQPAIALTTSAILAIGTALLSNDPAFATLRWLATDAVAPDPSGGDRARPIAPADLAFLQYTSGSTAAPRGVMLTHANLLHNAALIQHAFEHTPASRGVIWLPPYHDMGLIGGILQPLYVGFPVVLMSPLDFLQRPLRWLQAVSRFRATTSGGSNFAYDLCVRKTTPEQRATLDLSSWQVAFNGAEPVRADTLARFAAAFAPCGFRQEAFYPCYGLAEATLIVSGGSRAAAPVVRPFASAALERNRVIAARADAPSEGRLLVGCGQALLDQQLVIVHLDRLTRCRPDEVGEIWVRGHSVAQGYWQRPEETVRTFAARQMDGEEEPFLRTGDLGFLQDGELFVAGRLKDLIIIRGRNHYPQDIEQTVERCHVALRPGCGAAFAVEVAGAERLVVAQEVDRKYQAGNLDEVVGAIRAAVAAQHEVQVYAAVLLRTGSIPKTSSGKVQRHACREGFVAGRLEVIGSYMLDEAVTVDDDVPEIANPELTRAALLAVAAEARHPLLETYLRAVAARVLRIVPSRLDPRQPVSALGLDSLMAVELQHAIETDLGVVIPMVLFLQGHSITQLATEILTQVVAPPAPDESRPARAPQSMAEYPLAYGQRALWFLQHLAPESPAYHIASAVRIRGELDVPSLRHALQALVDRHPSLRTTFPHDASVQQVHPHTAVHFQAADVSHWSAADLDAHLVAETHRPFDLAHGPLLRISLLRRAAGEHVLLLVVHHLVADLWSLAVLTHDLEQLYVAAREGHSPVLPPLAWQYSDYVHWQRALLAGPEGQRLWAYWQQQLAGAPTALELPTDHPRPPVQTYRGAARAFTLGARLAQQLAALAQEAETTLFTTLLAAFQVLLFRYTGQEDLLVSAPTTGRSRAAWADIVGYFVNLVALRADLSGNPPFRAVLARARETVQAAVAHQDYPFAMLVERLQPERDPSRSPLSQVVFAFQQAQRHEGVDVGAFALGEHGATMNLGGLAIESLALEQRVVQFDLTLMVAEVAAGLVVSLQYNADLFESATIERMAEHVQTLLAGIVAAPDRRLTDLPLLTETERQQLLVAWNSTGATYPADACIQQLVEAQAARLPDAIAVIGPASRTASGEEQWLTYGELNRRANQVAHYLGQLGIGPEVRVAVCMARSLDLVIGQLGILKAGGAYVPLDPSYPPSRLAFMLADTQAPVLLTTTDDGPTTNDQRPGANDLRSQSKIQNPKSKIQNPVVVDLDADWERIAQERAENPDSAITADNLAYVIYTSGSTGRPKGVEIAHQGLLNLVCWHQRSYGVTPDDRATHLAGLGFDASVWELWPYLAAGASVALADDEIRAAPARLRDWIVARAITISFLPTPLAEATLALPWPEKLALRALLTGGDQLRQYPAPSLPFTLVNHYGPTEYTVVTLATAVQAETRPTGRMPPIGRPIANTQVFLLDRFLQPVPVGIPGELYIGGAGVARGYLKRPDLTAERFIPNPFGMQNAECRMQNACDPSAFCILNSAFGARLYRTGDLARYRPDGSLELLGRTDQQVKVRGFRIEPGEIEAVLDRHPGVREALVVARADLSGERRLVAYVVEGSGIRGQGSEDAALIPDPRSLTPELRTFLKEHLPDYMVPDVFIILDAVPTTPNGKVDYRALPAPDWAWPDREQAYAAPRTPLEEQLVAAWAEILGVERVGIYDSFFLLGGHSLQATELVARLCETFQVDLPLRSFFTRPRVADLAATIAQKQAEQGEVTARSPIVPQPRGTNVFPLSFAQQRLWFLDQVNPGTPIYNIPIAVRMTGALDVAVLEKSLNEIVCRHESLRTTFAMVDGRPVQIIALASALELPVIDIQAGSASAREAEIDRLIAEEAQRSFDLTRGPLVRATLLHPGEREHVLLLTMHHIVSDGWSIAIVLRELETLYTAYVAGRPTTLPELPIQYADYAVWQAEWLQGAVLETQRAYWRAQLDGAPPVLDLPLDRLRAPVRTFRSARRALMLSEPLSEALRTLTRQEEVTLFMTLLAAFKVLLYRYSGQSDIVVGSPIAGRTRAETNDLIGFFLNTLVLRTDLSGDPTFGALLGRVREVCLGAYAHQDLPFEKLLEELQPERDLSHTPLFQVFFNMLNIPNARVELPGLSLEILTPPDTGAKFDITLYVEEKDQHIKFDLVYNADLFVPARMEELLEQLQLLLSQIVANREERIDRFTLVTSRARACLPDPTAPLAATWAGAVYTGVSRQARRRPERLAVVDPHESWTYAALDAWSNQLANYLIAQGIRPQDVVAVYAHRSATLVWALLGVLKAGAAFTILDPAYPAARLIDYITLAQPRGWIQIAAAGALPDALEEFVATLACCCHIPLAPRAAAAPPGPLASYSTDDPQVVVGPDDLAYLIFTSGSTGRPKGILGTHRPLSHFLEWHRQTFGLVESDRFSMLSGLSYDPVLRDIFTPLWTGATVCLPDPQAIRSSGCLAEWMQQAAISVVHLTPALSILLSEGALGGTSASERLTLPDLRYAFFGGDVLTQQDVARLRLTAPAATCVNFYGATETPQGMGHFVIPGRRDEADDDGLAEGAAQAAIPLGRGIEGVQLLVLNAAGQLAGIGELGEIYVRTPYLARGYLGDEALTAARFIANPFGMQNAECRMRNADDPSEFCILNSAFGARLYRTSDLARYLPDGSVMFHGRADQQVKIRGFRVEPGEIETVLGQHPAVRECAVVAREDVSGDKRLVAYIVQGSGVRGQGDKETRRQGLPRVATRGDKEIGSKERPIPNPQSPIPNPQSLIPELRAFLQERLPGYMVPSAFVPLEALPLTPNGKVDRKALPKPDSLRPRAAYTVPQTEIERTIAAIWQAVLHVEVVGVEDNFFDLGGSSIHTVQVQNRLREALQSDIPIIELFKYPTVGSLAKSLNQKRREQPSFQTISDRAKKQNEVLERQRQLRSRLSSLPRSANVTDEGTS